MQQRVARSVVLIILFFTALIGACPEVKAQPGNPAAMAMTEIIVNLQTGAMNWNRFYPSAKQVIAMQTGGTGRYEQLAALGPVMLVQQTGGWVLPAGYFYYFRAFFQGGTVDWQIASDFQGNILGLSFMPVNQSLPQIPGPPAPQPSTTPPVTPVHVEGGTSPSNPKSKSDACKKFPDLCPVNSGA